MGDDALRIYRRDLPHWRVKEAAYFVTWRVSAVKRYLQPRERAIVATALHVADGFVAVEIDAAEDAAGDPLARQRRGVVGPAPTHRSQPTAS